MPKDKERSINPAQAQRKLDKAKALKKSKAELQARRNEKLARRNPDRLQRQIDDLKALESSGEIKPREKQILADLERDVKAIRKARDVLGDKAPQFENRERNERREANGGNGNVLGKRRHDGERKPPEQPSSPSGSDTDESVRRIPMPRDTPPPIPYQHQHRQKPNPRNANLEPLGEGHGRGERPQQTLPPRPPVVVAAASAPTTYSSAPQLRDLKKEAVSRFVPNVVRRKQDAVRGTTGPGHLLEPEELDRLEEQGYMAGVGRGVPRLNADPAAAEVRGAGSGDADDDPGQSGREGEPDELQRLADEEERFQREQLTLQDQDESSNHDADTRPKSRASHHVEIEEVDDEDL